MTFLRQSGIPPRRLGILAGTFNPVTVAHMALAGAARTVCDEVLFALPRIFPHKQYSGASFNERIGLLDVALHDCREFSLAVTEGGLFVEIARECREAYGNSVRLSFLCGRDAAERVAGWEYGRPGAFADMLREFDLLVAGRNGEFTPPPELSAGIERLNLPAEFDPVSASEVRQRIACGQPWEHLVPAAIRQSVMQIYSSGTSLTGLD